MNDFAEIRAARPQVAPPTDAVIAAARAAMWESHPQPQSRRSAMRRGRGLRFTIAATGLAALAAAAVLAIRTIGPDGNTSANAFRITTAPAVVAATDRLRIEGGDLLRGGRTVATNVAPGEELIDPLTGTLVPIAVSDPSRPGLVVVSTWRQLAPQPGQGGDGAPDGRPSLRVVDTATGRSSLMVSGAHAAAIARDGRIAFARGVQDVVRNNRRYLTHIVVRSGPQGRDVTWTTRPGAYFPLMWAGGTLIAYQQTEGEHLDVIALDGPGKQRTLLRGGTVVALSPTGDRAFVSTSAATVAIITVASGATIASASVNPKTDATGTAPVEQPLVIADNGDWQGERVVANSTRGLVVFTTRGGLKAERIIKLPGRPHGIDQPRLLGKDQLLGSADGSDTDYRNAVLLCTFSAGTCASGEPGTTPRDWRRWVDNQSR